MCLGWGRQVDRVRDFPFFFLDALVFLKKGFSVTRAESFIFCSSVVIENEGRSFFSFSRTILSSKKADFQSFKK
jgi:hypothetical protein